MFRCENCDNCSKTFPNLNSLKAHIIKSNEKKDNETTSASESNLKEEELPKI